MKPFPRLDFRHQSGSLDVRQKKEKRPKVETPENNPVALKCFAKLWLLSVFCKYAEEVPNSPDCYWKARIENVSIPGQFCLSDDDDDSMIQNHLKS